MGNFSTEIRTFYSIKDIRESIETEIAQYKALLDDYSQWLGSLLRNPESSKNQALTKKAAELQRILKSGGRKGSRKEEKKGAVSSEWVQFKEIMVGSDEVGEAEILFDAIEDLKDKISRLEKAKNSLVDLERYGLGKEVLYIAFIHDGVLEKLVIKPMKAGVPQKFEFMANFSVIKQT